MDNAFQTRAAARLNGAAILSGADRFRLLRRFVLAAVGSVLLTGTAVAHEPSPVDGRACAKVGTWFDPATGKTIAPGPLMAALARRKVVLLGERHDNAEHHRWQLQMLAALHAHQPDMTVGFEMFPRRVQPELDRWAAGGTDAATFLQKTDWGRVWSYDPNLYLPMFHFVRQNRLPMIAINIDRALIARVGREGWAAIPADQRGGLSDPVAASDAYLDDLSRVFLSKQSLGVGVKDGRAEHRKAPVDPAKADHASVMETDEFKNFVAAQLTWDRAMAEALAKALRERPKSLVVGVVGRGHLQFGHGIPHQLADLGVADAAVLLPMDAAQACEAPAKIADAVFVVAPRESAAEARPKARLGIMVKNTDKGVRIMQVKDGSVAAASALVSGDILVSAAGRQLKDTSQLIAIVQRQAPGTWLPLMVRRQDKDFEVVAKFPTEFKKTK